MRIFSLVGFLRKTENTGVSLMDIDINCKSCNRSGEYAWGACPYCDTRYTSRAPLPTSSRIALAADTLDDGDRLQQLIDFELSKELRSE